MKRFSKLPIEKTYRFILMCISLPTIIAIALLSIIILFSVNKITDISKTNTVRTMSSVSEQCKDNIRALESTVKLFISLCADKTNGDIDMLKLLKYFPGKANHVISAYIFDQNINTIYDGFGTYDVDDYYKNINSYDIYDASYWKSFIFYTSGSYRLLSPCKLNISGTEYNTIPMVFKYPVARSYIVLNIDLNSIMPISKLNRKTATNYYIINNSTKNIFQLGNDVEYNTEFSEDFKNLIISRPNNSFYYSLPQCKSLVCTTTEWRSIIGYTYIAITPIRELYKGMFVFIIILFLIMIIATILITYSILTNASKIFIPIKETYTTLSGTTIDSGNMLYNNITLAKKASNDMVLLKKTLPYAQEKYLVNLLNGLDIYNKDKTIGNSFSFKYNFFSVVIMQLSPTFAFYDKFNENDYEMIKIGFYDIIYDLFSQHFASYILPAENNILNIVLNFNTCEQYGNIKNILSEIINFLKNDFEYITLSIGISQSLSGISGLRTAHKEAVENFIPYNTPEKEPSINIDSVKIINFTQSDEADLYYSLSTLNKDKIMETINKLLHNSDDLSPRNQKRLYNYILNTILRYFHVNKIPYMEDLLDFEIANKFLAQPLPNIKEYIEGLINYLTAKKESKSDFDKVYAYIKANCCSQDISLKQLADIFETSQSTITRMVQSNTGFSFKQLINNLRIDKSKELLKNSKLSTEEIYELVGFTNKQTFYRVFKATVGITPAEYKQKE